MGTPAQSLVNSYSTLTQQVRKRIGTVTYSKINPSTPNPVDDNNGQTIPQLQGAPIPRRRGYFAIQVTDPTATAYTWRIEVSGGYFTDVLADINYYFHVGTNINCTVTTSATSPNILYVTTPAADHGGRVYQIGFSTYFSFPASLYNTTYNTSPIAGDLMITVTDYQAQTTGKVVL